MTDIKLTPEQEAEVKALFDELVGIAESTDRIDPAEVTAAVADVYAAYDRAPVPVVILPSVEAAAWCFMVAQAFEPGSHRVKSAAAADPERITPLRRAWWDSFLDQLDAQGFLVKERDHYQIYEWRSAPMPEFLWGAAEQYWFAYYNYVVHTFTPADANRAKLEAHDRIARAAGPWIPCEHMVIVADRPTAIHVDDRSEPHNLDGPAMTWSDGVEYWFLHGREVPAWSLLERGKPGHVHRVLAEIDNTETRRMLIELGGWDNAIAELEEAGMKLVSEEDDPANPGRTLRLYDLGPIDLYGLDDPDDDEGQPVRLLVMTNASPDPSADGWTWRIFAETVPAAIDSAVDAAAWQFGVDPAEYRKMARAT